ncbi:MAG: hypothetical protein R2873_13340 [Caldilineaceae bacterium]
MSTRFLGITTMTPFIQAEGIETVLDNVAGRARILLTINTSVIAPMPKARDNTSRPPTASASASLRAWCGTSPEFWYRSGPGHHARTEFFAGLEVPTAARQ